MTVFRTITTATPVVDVAVSRYASATDNRGRTTTLAAVTTEMRDSDALRKSSGKLRAEYALNGKSAAYDSLKRRMPAVIFAGVCEPPRGIDTWTTPSGLICMDVDGVTTEVGAELLAELQHHPAIVLAFHSFRAGGVKFVIQLTPAPATEAEHHHAFYAAQGWFADAYGVAVDSSCIDPSRLCFLASGDVELRQPTNALDWQAFDLPEAPAAAVTRKARRSAKHRAAVSGDVTPGNRASALLDAELKHISQSLGACDDARDCLAVMIALRGVSDGEVRYLRFAWWHDAAEASARFRAARPQDPKPLATISAIARRHGFDQRAYYKKIAPAAPHRRMR